MTLQTALVELIGRGSVLVATDFDGTIAPTVEHPDLAQVNDKAISALLGLAVQTSVKVAIVSGRPYRDLERLLPESDKLILIGEHGNDYGRQHGSDPRVAQVATKLDEIAARLEGSYVELKNNSVGFHWRRATSDPGNAVAAVERLANAHGEFSVLKGKKLIELSLVTRTKGDAVGELAENADGAVFFGDDTTDETVFEILRPGDVGVKVGEGPTAASYHIRDVDEVADLLEMLLGELLGIPAVDIDDISR